MAHCFDTVHDAAATSRLNYAAWELWFDQILPSLSWARNWDKCERLRRGLIGSVVLHDWPVNLLARCTHKADTFERLLISCRDVKGGKKVLRDLWREAQDRSPELSIEYRALVSRHA